MASPMRWTRSGPSPTTRLRTVLLVALLAIGATAGCGTASEEERRAALMSTAEGRALYETFQRDRGDCRRIAERITPRSERYIAFSGAFRDEWVEKQVLGCMSARGWKNGGRNGWDQGRRR